MVPNQVASGARDILKGQIFQKLNLVLRLLGVFFQSVVSFSSVKIFIYCFSCAEGPHT